jgi:RND family efflux transporter MFP subunit
MAPAAAQTLITALEAVGTLESPYRVEISPRTSGRIEYLEAREGDTVRPGQVLVRIDPSELQGQVLQQQAAVAQARSRLAEAQLGQAPAEVNVAGQIRQQRASLTSARAELTQVQSSYSATVAASQAAVADAEARVKSAQAQVRNAEAELGRQQANLRNAQTRFNRIDGLYRQGFIAAQDVDDARTAVEVQQGSVEVAQGQLAAARSAVTAAQQQVRAAQAQLTIAKRKGVADIAAARARVTQSQAGVSIASANRAQSPAYQQNLSALQAGVQAAQAQLSQAQSRLGETVLRSSVAGTVTSRSADPGALASPGTPVLVVQFLDWLYVTSSLPIERVSEVFVGQPVEVRVDALPNQVFQGKISNINPVADVQNRQFGIRVRLANPGQRLKPGMYGRVSVVTKRIAAEVTVPREAVKTTPEGGSTVTVIAEDGTASVREVTVGASDSKVIQLLSGVRPGEKVVTLSYMPIRDGQKVRLPGQRGGGEGGPGGQGGGSGGAPAGGRREGGGSGGPR